MIRSHAGSALFADQVRAASADAGRPRHRLELHGVIHREGAIEAVEDDMIAAADLEAARVVGRGRTDGVAAVGVMRLAEVWKVIGVAPVPLRRVDGHESDVETDSGRVHVYRKGLIDGTHQAVQRLAAQIHDLHHVVGAEIFFGGAAGL